MVTSKNSKSPANFRPGNTAAAPPLLSFYTYSTPEYIYSYIACALSTHSIPLHRDLQRPATKLLQHTILSPARATTAPPPRFHIASLSRARLLVELRCAVHPRSPRARTRLFLSVYYNPSLLLHFFSQCFSLSRAPSAIL